MTNSDEVRRWPSLLTVPQAADMLGRNEQTVRIWCREGVVRARRMSGGSYVLDRQEVLVDVARHERDVAATWQERGARRRSKNAEAKGTA